LQAADARSEPTPAETPRPWLVVGLGNPGPEYELTPHNLGFLVVDDLAKAHGIAVKRKESMALVGAGTIANTSVMLAKPQTYMNRSGPSVKGLLERRDLGPENLILVYDELALPWGSLRVRPQGSSAGHNGVESVISSLGTPEFIRVRMGIHPEHPVEDGAEFVLRPMRKSLYKELDELLDYSARAVESIIAEGVSKAMTKYNRRARGSNLEEE